jgi:hypothetical protein
VIFIDFKEVIRREVVEKIANAIDFAFKAGPIMTNFKINSFDSIEEGEGKNKGDHEGENEGDHEGENEGENEDFKDCYFSDEDEYKGKQQDTNSDKSDNSMAESPGKKLLTRRSTIVKKSFYNTYIRNCFRKSKKKLLNRDTSYKIFGDRTVMTKI